MVSGATSSSIQGETSRPRRAAATRSMPARSQSSRRSSRMADDEVPMDVDFDLPELVISSGKRPNARRKAARPPEATQGSTTTTNGVLSPTNDTAPAAPLPTEPPSASLSSRSKRSRQPARPKASSTKVTIKPDPDQIVTDLSRLEPPPPKASSSKKKANGTGSAGRNHKPVTPPTLNGQTSAEAKTEATPTLKIRLPRLGAFNSPSTTANQAAAADTSKASPTKAAVASASASRPRRSLRRQASIPTPLNSASVSEAGSSRANDTGLPASPLGSL